MSIELENAAAATAPPEAAINSPALAPPAPALTDSQVLTVIRPSRGWQLVNVRELCQFREMLYCLVWRDVKVRYKQTALGAAWAVHQPLLMMAVFSVFFGRLAGVNSD